MNRHPERPWRGLYPMKDKTNHFLLMVLKSKQVHYTSFDFRTMQNCGLEDKKKKKKKEKVLGPCVVCTSYVRHACLKKEKHLNQNQVALETSLSYSAK